MGRKKKAFIDKKRSSTFHLLHRSQRDVSEHVFYNQEEEDNETSNTISTSSSSGMVLWPSPHNSAETNRAVLLLSDRKKKDNNNGESGGGGGGDRMKIWREKLQQAGLLEEQEEKDDEDENKYLKEMTGEGVFLHANGGQTTAASAYAVNILDTDVLEVKANSNNMTPLDNIALKQAIDEDIEALLNADDNDDIDFDDFEDLNDEFVLDAAQEPAADDDDKVDQAAAAAAAAFDYDAHIQKLMEKARRERDLDVTADTADRATTTAHHETGQQDQAFFSQLQPLHERNNEDENDDDDDDSFANIPDYHDDNVSQLVENNMTAATTIGVVPKLNPDEERALCEKFAETLLEYDDSDDEEDNNDQFDDGENPAAGSGGLPLEGNQVVEAALDEFLVQHQNLNEDDNLMVPKNVAIGDDDNDDMAAKKTGGSGFTVLQGKEMVRDSPWTSASNPAVDGEQKESVQQVLSQATSRLAEPIVKPPAEEILIDGQSYFSERQRNPWDCESILSTYSNLDNNPVTVDTTTSRRRKHRNKKIQQFEEEPEQQIRLSSKTGLPLGVFSSGRPQEDDYGNYDDDDNDDTMVSINKGQARSKKETAEEKKARKAAIKRERQLTRVQKKVTRHVFATEMAKRTADAETDVVAGKSVFRYS